MSFLPWIAMLSQLGQLSLATLSTPNVVATDGGMVSLRVAAVIGVLRRRWGVPGT
jgi:hypothetical protein